MRLFKIIGYLIIIFFLTLVSCDPSETDIDDDNNNPNDKDTAKNIIKITNYKIEGYDIYSTTSLPEIKLTISNEQWNIFLNNFDSNPSNEEYVMCNFKATLLSSMVNIDSCGLRMKGNTSRRRPEGTAGQLHNVNNPDWHHASFSVKFNEYRNGISFHGRKRINLKWFKDDPMYVREIYCYDLFRKFGVLTAPRSGYCKLSINITGDSKPAYFGVYELLEVVDDEYLESRKDVFGDDNGFLWKANWGADFISTDFSRMGIENITLKTTYTPVYDFKSNINNLSMAKEILADFITNLNSKTGDDFKSWISSTMDVPLFLKTYAVNVMCGMWDDYWGNKNNFYFYFNNQGKFFFIPYDYDNTLGTSYIIKDSGRQDMLNWGNNTYPLVKKLISVPEFLQLYKKYLNQLINSEYDLFYVTASINRINYWQNLIKNYVSNDTGEDMNIYDMPANWGNCPFYRLLDSNNNFFTIKASSVPN